MRKYDSVEVGKYLMALANERGIVLNVTKVQKLLFIVYGYFLAKHNRVIIDEQPKAWPFGPVFPRAKKQIDYSKIIKLDYEYLNVVKQDAELTEFLIQLLSDFGNLSALTLTEWSHKEGSPWHRTTQQQGFKWNTPIPDEYIKEYFTPIFNGNPN
ncbi:MAG: hypothetical protein K0Q79_322 [Flavipsychrobacter sp.]|jgi:uncharacterized phage-associated protein|nr:hypothetical protein [Flavipsychrobacter sp.]